MKLCYWAKASRVPNFGDVLNPYIFEKLLGNILDDDANSIFVGIGTLLERGIGETLNIPPKYVKNNEPLSRWIVVFGSGAGYYDPPTIDQRWRIYCVRGPLTAKLLGVEQNLAVADPAILIRTVYRKESNKAHKVSLMPHHSNAGEVLKCICEEIGFNYIDPLSPVEGILEAICSTETLLTEALHGAIVADAMRTPWIPIQTTKAIFSFKWEDWCRSINKEYEPIVTTDMINRIWIGEKDESALKKMKKNIKITMVERNLRSIANRATPMLSDDNVMENLTRELERRLQAFRRDVSEGIFI